MSRDTHEMACHSDPRDDENADPLGQEEYGVLTFSLIEQRDWLTHGYQGAIRDTIAKQDKGVYRIVLT